MAYKVNDKVYTDQPMMDEIVYYCKIIFNQIVIKNDVAAANSEYENSLSLSEAYSYGLEHNNFIPFSIFPYNKKLLTVFNEEILAPLGIAQAPSSLDLWVESKSYIPTIVTYDGEEYNVRLLLEQFCNDWFYGRLEEEGTIDFAAYKIDSKFVEKNNYYRTLMGLPPYEDPSLPDLEILKNQYYIYLTDPEKGTVYTDYFPADYIIKTENPDTTPIHEYDVRDITVLQIEGAIDKIRELYPGYKYSYVNFLGERSLKLIDIRKAGKWDIIYFPNVEPLIETRFLDLYEKNKEIYMDHYYEVTQANHSFYYDQNMIIKLLAKVFGDMVTETPEWYIRRDVLDLRSVEYFLESYGVKFFKQIPLKYQKRIVRNLNKLIKFKSSTRNFEDILDIFELPETMIYKYFLFKKRDKDNDGSYSYSIESDNGMLNFGNINRGDVQASGDWDFGSFDNYPEMSQDTVVIDGATYDLGNEDSDPKVDPESVIEVYLDEFSFDDDGTQFFLNENTGEEHAVGDHDYGDPDEQDPESVVPAGKDVDLLSGLRYLTNPRRVTVPIEAYDLEFVATEIHDSYNNYMRDNIYRTPYDDITYQDKYWDADQDHEQVKNDIKAQDFTIQGTKYMSIEYQIPANEYFFQIEYFLNLLLSSTLDTDDIKIPVPCIAQGEEFKLSDLFFFLSVLTDSYYRKDSYDGTTVIRRPETISPEDLLAEFEVTEKNYDWKKVKLPEIYTDKKGRVFAFNPRLDKDELAEFLSRRHSHHRFGLDTETHAYTDQEYVDLYLQDDLDRLGITDFIVPNGSCSTVDELVDLYQNNKECYEKFKHEVKNNLNNADELKTMEYVYQQMYTAQFDSDFYKLSDGTDAYDLVDILRDRNYVLYNKYRSIASEANRESRQDIIRQIMNDIIETLQYYLTDEGLEYIFAFAATEGFNSRIQYIYLMITFFKSYKVHFIDPYVTYKINDRMMNGDLNGEAAAMDQLSQLRLDFLKKDKQMIREFVYKNISYVLPDRTYQEEERAEIVDIYSRFSPDPDDDYDYDGMHPADFSDVYKEANGGIPDRKVCIPYIMLNAGMTRNRVYQMWNINGSSPANADDRNYSDIDGGKPLELDFHLGRRDWFGKEGFNYIVDGGSPSHMKFISNSMRLTLKHTGELGADVRLSQKVGNAFSSDANGITVLNEWVDKGDFTKFTEDYQEYFDEVSAKLAQAYEDIEVVKDEEALTKRIKKCADEVLYPIETVMHIVHNDGEGLVDVGKTYASDKNSELYNYFMQDGKIFDWENLIINNDT